MSGYKAGKLFDLTGQVAVVTGASRGLGSEIAKCLAANGADLALCARDSAGLKNVAESVEKEYGVRTFTMSVDLTDAAKVQEFAKSTYQKFGHIEMLINNAAISGSTILSHMPQDVRIVGREGLGGPMGGFAIINTYEIKEKKTGTITYNDLMPPLAPLKNTYGGIIRTNYLMTQIMTDEVAKYMKEGSYGRIVNISSVYGLREENRLIKEKYNLGRHTFMRVPRDLTRPEMYRYYESKKLEISQTLENAKKYGGSKITVNAIAPSLIQMGKELPSDMGEYLEFNQIVDAKIKPENIMPAILSLTSPFSNSITGIVVPIDGGWSARERGHKNKPVAKQLKNLEGLRLIRKLKVIGYTILYGNYITATLDAFNSVKEFEDKLDEKE